jgi:hypothetical protein
VRRAILPVSFEQVKHLHPPARAVPFRPEVIEEASPLRAVEPRFRASEAYQAMEDLSRRCPFDSVVGMEATACLLAHVWLIGAPVPQQATKRLNVLVLQDEGLTIEREAGQLHRLRVFQLLLKCLLLVHRVRETLIDGEPVSLADRVIDLRPEVPDHGEQAGHPKNHHQYEYPGPRQSHGVTLDGLGCQITSLHEGFCTERPTAASRYPAARPDQRHGGGDLAGLEGHPGGDGPPAVPVAYEWVLEHRIDPALIRQIVDGAQRGVPQYFHDMEDNGDINDPSMPLAHACLLAQYLNRRSAEE